MNLTFEQQIALIKQEDLKKPKKQRKKRDKPMEGEVILRYNKHRIKYKGRDLNYHQIADLVLSRVKITVICSLTKQDLTERVILATMNTYLASYKGNLEKYLEILTSSKIN